MKQIGIAGGPRRSSQRGHYNGAAFPRAHGHGIHHRGELSFLRGALIIHKYRTDQYVAASLALFSGVMLPLWYVIRLLIALKKE